MLSPNSVASIAATPYAVMAGAAEPAAPSPTPAAPAPGIELFGSFILGCDEFALPAACIREVVNYPAKVTALPLSPAFLEGMFTLRGCVIPIVNLGRVFSPSARAAEPGHKIAILDFQGVLIGILFHDTGEILRVRPEQRSTLSYSFGDRHGVVAGTILLDQGERLLQVLDPAALISIENVPQVLALQSAGKQRDSRQSQAQGQKRQGVSFRAGHSSFAFEMSAIQEIIRVPELHTSILNSKLCLGRINFRGSQVAVVDFSALLGGAPAAGAGSAAPHAMLAEASAEPSIESPAEAQPQPAESVREFLPDQRIVIARIDDATVGFLVDSVDNIINFFSDEILPIPLLSKARAGMFGGCICKPELGDIIFLNHREIFSQTEIVEMRNGHASLYPQDEARAGAGAREQRRSQRQVYLTFALEHTFAVEIKQVREIIDFSGDISRPPGMPAFMCGMLNLRQQMISLIDLRSLYHMAPLARGDSAKILIIERGEERYGLMVDAVKNIMTIDDKRRFSAPKMMRNTSGSDQLRGEMDDVIDVDGADGDEHQTLCVFECDRLIERLAREMPALAA